MTKRKKTAFGQLTMLVTRLLTSSSSEVEAHVRK